MRKWIHILKPRIGFFVFVTLLRLNFTSCSKVSYSHLKWQTSTVATDGKPSEWALPLKFYDQESKLNYDISNDRKNLYVIFKITDEFTKVKALKAGIRFAIDVEGKKIFPVTLSYVYPQEHHLLPLPGESIASDGESAEERMRENLNFQGMMLKLSGFKAELKEGLLAMKNEYGINAAMEIDNNDILYYELRIPFATFYKESITPSDTLVPFNFEITLNALQQPDRASAFLNDDQSQAPPSSGNGNFPDGNMSGTGAPGGNIPGGGGPRQSMNRQDEGNSKRSITQKLKLSIK